MRSAWRIVGGILLAGMISAFGALAPGQGAPVSQFSVVAAQTPANAENNYNGTSNGKLVLTVPVGATVQITFKNQGALPHSLQVIPPANPLPATALSAPAFPGAQIPNPQAGIMKGQTVNVQFTAAKAGKYLMICGFPGHALLGMYATFVVAPSPTAAPSMTVTK
jgi:sulfocyanin